MSQYANLRSYIEFLWGFHFHFLILNGLKDSKMGSVSDSQDVNVKLELNKYVPGQLKLLMYVMYLFYCSNV